MEFPARPGVEDSGPHTAYGLWLQRTPRGDPLCGRVGHPGQEYVEKQAKGPRTDLDSICILWGEKKGLPQGFLRRNSQREQEHWEGK